MQGTSKRARPHTETETAPGFTPGIVQGLTQDLEDDRILEAIFDPKNRPNPYPLFAKLQEHRVSWQKGGMSETGSYVVSHYNDVVGLLHDTRLSSDTRKSKVKLFTAEPKPPSFINFDPPEHDRLRRLTTRHFGPPNRPEYVEQFRSQIEEITNDLIQSLKNQSQDVNQNTKKTSFDLVNSVAKPLPVLMIAKILGVPKEDESKFKIWSDTLIDFLPINTPEAQGKVEEARTNLTAYIASLVHLRKNNPKDDLISRMITDTGPEGRMEEQDLIATATLLLIAGHETTVNLISNGMLTLLRHPSILERLRQEPDLIIGTVEELLRYEPPVQMLVRRSFIHLRNF